MDKIIYDKNTGHYWVLRNGVWHYEKDNPINTGFELRNGRIHKTGAYINYRAGNHIKTIEPPPLINDTWQCELDWRLI